MNSFYRSNGEITPILNPGKKSNRTHMWVFFFLFNKYNKKDTINRGRYFFQAFFNITIQISGGSVKTRNLSVLGFGSAMEKWVLRQVEQGFSPFFVKILLYRMIFFQSGGVL